MSVTGGNGPDATASSSNAQVDNQSTDRSDPPTDEITWLTKTLTHEGNGSQALYQFDNLRNHFVVKVNGKGHTFTMEVAYDLKDTVPEFKTWLTANNIVLMRSGGVVKMRAYRNSASAQNTPNQAQSSATSQPQLPVTSQNTTAPVSLSGAILVPTPPVLQPNSSQPKTTLSVEAKVNALIKQMSIQAEVNKKANEEREKIANEALANQQELETKLEKIANETLVGQHELEGRLDKMNDAMQNTLTSIQQMMKDLQTTNNVEGDKGQKQVAEDYVIADVIESADLGFDIASSFRPYQSRPRQTPTPNMMATGTQSQNSMFYQVPTLSQPNIQLCAQNERPVSSLLAFGTNPTAPQLQTFQQPLNTNFRQQSHTSLQQQSNAFRGRSHTSPIASQTPFAPNQYAFQAYGHRQMKDVPKYDGDANFADWLCVVKAKLTVHKVPVDRWADIVSDLFEKKPKNQVHAMIAENSELLIDWEAFEKRLNEHFLRHTDVRSNWDSACNTRQYEDESIEKYVERKTKSLEGVQLESKTRANLVIAGALAAIRSKVNNMNVDIDMANVEHYLQKAEEEVKITHREIRRANRGSRNDDKSRDDSRGRRNFRSRDNSRNRNRSRNRSFSRGRNSSRNSENRSRSTSRSSFKSGDEKRSRENSRDRRFVPKESEQKKPEGKKSKRYCVRCKTSTHDTKYCKKDTPASVQFKKADQEIESDVQNSGNDSD